MTRKSPAFHFAVAIVTRSVRALGVSAEDRADAGPNPPPFLAFTVNEYGVPAVSSVMVRLRSAVSRTGPTVSPVVLL